MPTTRRKLAAPPEQVRLAWYEAWPGQLGLIALAAIVAYAGSLHVPFYLDDFSSIQENSLIYRWQGFEALRHYAPMRVLCYLTFALNYQLGHFQPAGYHLVNIAIHVLAGAAVYGLAAGLLGTPRLAGAVRPETRTWLPALAAALFLLHPLHTQAVTYTVQRLASMVAMFYIAALAAYVQARLAGSAGGRLAWGAACLALGALALFTKENAATLPLALLLIEATLFEHRPRGLAALAGAAAAALVLEWLVAALAFGRDPFSIQALAGLTSQSTDISRASYFATQMPVLWTYLRLFLLPVGLHLDYGVALLPGLSSGKALVALAGHLVVVGLALAAWRQRPLVTFALLFYYLAHAVESSLIPIPELAFEHRAYLPDLGLCLLAAWLALARTPRDPSARQAVAALAGVVLLVLGVLTWQRNRQWADPVAFWRDNCRIAPTKARAWGNLGKCLLEANRPEEASNALGEALRLQRAGIGSGAGGAMDAVNLIAALQMLNRGDEALALISRQLEGTTAPSIRALLYLNRGNIHFEHRAYAAAESSYRSALALDPGNRRALANLASAFAQSGRYAAAESLYERVLIVDPDDQETRVNLLQARVGRLIEEADAYRAAHRAESGAEAYRAALATVRELQQIDPGNPVIGILLRRIEQANRRPSR